MLLLGLIAIPNWIIIALIALILLHIYLTRKNRTFKAMGIAGPKPRALFGNILQELKQFVPDLDVENSKAYGKVHGVFEATTPTIRVADPEIVREICIKEFNSFTNHRSVEMSAVDPLFGLLLSVLKDEEWKQTRHVMTPSFTGAKLKMMAPLIEKCSQPLLASFKDLANDRKSFDVKEKLINYLMDVIGSCAFGMEMNAQRNEDDDFAKYAKRFTSKRNVFLLLAILVLPKMILKRMPLSFFDEESVAFFKKVTQKIIHLRQTKNERRNDFLQLMLDSLNDAKTNEPETKPNTKVNADMESPPSDKIIKKVLTENGVLAQSLTFLVAGFKTTSATLSFMCYLLATHPDCQEKLLQEVDEILAENDGNINYETISKMRYMDMVLSETLRMYPPALRTDRECNKDCLIKDLFIPKGMVVTICVNAIHNSDEFYENPDKFDPERFSDENKAKRSPFLFLPFGVGPRNCIGMRFALMNVKNTMAAILKEFRFVCAPETEVPLKFKKGVARFEPINGIWLRIERRHH